MIGVWRVGSVTGRVPDLMLYESSLVGGHTSNLCRRGHRIQGKYAEAQAFYERCQAMKKKALGPEHPSLAATLGSRAGVLEKQVRGARCFPTLVEGYDLPWALVWSALLEVNGLISWRTAPWQ